MSLRNFLLFSDFLHYFHKTFFQRQKKIFLGKVWHDINIIHIVK
jgi:hypothetical protein